MSATRPLVVRSVILAALTVAVRTGMAAPADPVVTDADIERARRGQPVITDQDVERARRQYGAPAAGAPNTAPVPSRPAIEALTQPATRTPLDLEALARGYSAQADAIAGAQGLANGPALLVFVSLSMPRPTIQRLLDQAARAQASVILRGFANGSLRETVAQVQALTGARRIAVQVDPQAFDRFSIARVPSFVLVRDGTRPVSCASGTCAPSEAFLRASGDVSLDYALEHMQRTAPAFRSDAARFLKRLRS